MFKNNNHYKILLLQIRSLRPAIIIKVTGDFEQKQTLNARKVEEEIKAKYAGISSNDKKLFIPRAKVSVRMDFFPNSNKIPEIHNLVKFYLDPLKSLAFTDDRQVHHLSANCWIPPGPKADGTKESVVYITVERLSNYLTRFDLYYSLLEENEFIDYLRSYHEDLIKKEEEDFDFLSDLKMLKIIEKIPGISAKELSQILEMSLSDYQRNFLNLSKIDKSDRPVGPKGIFYRKERAGFREIFPLAINLGDLPSKGNSKEYKQRIKEKFNNLRSKLVVFNKILVPIELDVRVTPREFKLGKDLDNIMRDIVPPFQEEFMRGEGKLNGYRIYVTDKLSEEGQPGSISIKLLPSNSVIEFDRRVSEVLEIAIEWLEKQI